MAAVDKNCDAAALVVVVVGVPTVVVVTVVARGDQWAPAAAAALRIRDNVMLPSPRNAVERLTELMGTKKCYRQRCNGGDVMRSVVSRLWHRSRCDEFVWVVTELGRHARERRHSECSEECVICVVRRRDLARSITRSRISLQFKV